MAVFLCGDVYGGHGAPHVYEVCGHAEFVGDTRRVWPVERFGGCVFSRADQQPGCESVCALLVAWHAPWRVAVVGVAELVGECAECFDVAHTVADRYSVGVRYPRAFWPAAVPSHLVAAGLGDVDECINQSGLHLAFLALLARRWSRRRRGGLCRPIQGRCHRMRGFRHWGPWCSNAGRRFR